MSFLFAPGWPSPFYGSTGNWISFWEQSPRRTLDSNPKAPRLLFFISQSPALGNRNTAQVTPSGEMRLLESLRPIVLCIAGLFQSGLDPLHHTMPFPSLFCRVLAGCAKAIAVLPQGFSECCFGLIRTCSILFRPAFDVRPSDGAHL